MRYRAKGKSAQLCWASSFAEKENEVPPEKQQYAVYEETRMQRQGLERASWEGSGMGESDSNEASFLLIPHLGLSPQKG